MKYSVSVITSIETYYISMNPTEFWTSNPKMALLFDSEQEGYDRIITSNRGGVFERWWVDFNEVPDEVAFRNQVVPPPNHPSEFQR